MAGTYTDIVEIEAPSEAVAGETVQVGIAIKNIYSASVHVYAVGVYDSEDRFIDWLDAWIEPGWTVWYWGNFVMPNRGVIIHAYSYYEDVDGYRRPDGEAEISVSLAEVFNGTISRKELEYDGVRSGIPVL